LVRDEGAERAMATDGGDHQRVLTPQQQSALIGLEGQAVDLPTPALDVGAHVGGELGVAVRLKCAHDLGK
jgi:hypothetical protein